MFKKRKGVVNRRLAILLVIALAVLHGATHVRPYDDIES